MSSTSIPRIVIDTNVLISAVIVAGGFPDRVVGAWFRRRVALLMCQQLFAELSEVLGRERITRLYRSAPERRKRIMDDILFAAEWVSPLDESSLPLSSRDPKDNKFLACALAAHADFIVSGDADLLALNGNSALGATRVVTPRELTELLYPLQDSR
ncbi:MAG: putative toxin-antitoxin system toxin component, PIN family [Chloroflexi bacterium]|nr:putative toxin-antitoxin system toxin component, PIN family [Chloroflexota bacterium]